MKETGSKKDNLELAEEHIKLAEELVVTEGKNSTENENKKLVDAELSLERAESDIEEIEENADDEN
jgi:hypothetical protein